MTSIAPNVDQVRVKAVLSYLRNDSTNRWLSLVVRYASELRPDLERCWNELQVSAAETNLLDGLSIGHISAIYEAVLAQQDRSSRVSNGQFFTPDDVASFMATLLHKQPGCTVIDPCCGVGNLAWHAARLSDDPAEFVRSQLSLNDRDETAAISAAVLITAAFAERDETSCFDALLKRTTFFDILTGDLPGLWDKCVVNPPYLPVPANSAFVTAQCRDLYAYVWERLSEVAKSIVIITPASFAAARKFDGLRELLDRRYGSRDVYVFDNVPDTIFRGYKHGSTNTSKTNFVRAAITSAFPTGNQRRITPIIRWTTRSRPHLFDEAPQLLDAQMTSEGGEWLKLITGSAPLYASLRSGVLADLVSAGSYTLQIAATPRYYISAVKRVLDRGSLIQLQFSSESNRKRAYLVLNSSLPYWWWRAKNGGVTLTRRDLLSLPLPDLDSIDWNLAEEIVQYLEREESENLVTKLNAGKVNQNVKHSATLVKTLNQLLFPEYAPLLAPSGPLYANDMIHRSVNVK